MSLTHFLIAHRILLLLAVAALGTQLLAAAALAVCLLPRLP
jgi:hypothetical protein